MTIAATIPKKIYEGDGLNKYWPIPFPVEKSEYLHLYVSRDSGGADPIDKDLYAVDLKTMKVTYPLSGNPVEAGKKIALVRCTTIDQSLDLVSVGNFFPEDLEGGFDHLVMIQQEMKSELDRTVRVPATAEDPEEFGRDVFAARDRAEAAASDAEGSAHMAASAAGSSAAYAGQSKGARDTAIEAKDRSEEVKVEIEGMLANIEDGGVTSVAGRSGVVTLITADITDLNNATPTVSGLMSFSDKDKLDRLSGVPVGMIISWAGITPPVGYLECKGQSLNKTTYPGLFAAIGYTWGGSGDAFYLPDFYSAGRFLRSRSSTLAVGTTQEDAIRNITGSALSASGTNDTLSGGTGALQYQNTTANTTNGGLYKINVGRLTIDSSLIVPTADENRPKNAAVMYCIKVADEYINPEQINMSAVHQEIIDMRDSMPLPLMFIQGFKIDYVDRTHIKVNSGACRSSDNMCNIHFTSSETVTLSNYSGWRTLYIHVVLKSDNTITFKVNEQANYVLIAGEKATRRIGSMIWEAALGICPFVSTLEAGGTINFAFMSNYNNFNWIGQSANTTPVVTPIPLTIPFNISCKGIGHLYIDYQAQETWSTVMVLRYDNGSMLSGSFTNWINGSQRFFFELNTTNSGIDATKIKLSYALLPGKQTNIQVFTQGYADWRID